MKLEELKNIIENKLVDKIPNLIIFKNTENSFLADQYIKEICNILNQEPRYISDLGSMTNNIESLFNSDPELFVYRCDILKDIINTEDSQSLFIVTDRIDEEVEKALYNYIVTIPKIERWQIKEYVKLLVNALNDQDVDNIINICNEDIYRIYNECIKLTIFDNSVRQMLFQEFKRSGIFNDLSQFTIFNLTNAIQNKDVDTIKSILCDINNIDVEPIGLLTVLINTFKKLILVWLNPMPTPENTGLSSKQIWAIGKINKKYSAGQVLQIYNFLTNLDFRIKSGDIPISILIDYIITTILTI